MAATQLTLQRIESLPSGKLAKISSLLKFDRPWEWRGGNAELIRSHDHEVILWGPAETGKSIAACYKSHMLCREYPGAQGALIRKIAATITGTIMLTMKRVIGNFPVTYYGGEQTPERIIYPNGSVIWVGGMDNPVKTLSGERDFIQVCQAEELNLNDWEIMTTRTTGRGAVVPYPQLYGDANPGPPRHWIQTRAAAGHLKLIRSYHRDNPTLWDVVSNQWTEQGQKTLTILGKLTGARKSRLLDGLWVAPEGAIYEQYDPARHSIQHFDPPLTWPRVVGIDPYGAYVGAVFGAYDSVDGKLHIYGESLQPFGITTPAHVLEIRSRLEGQTIWRWFGGGPSENQDRVDWRVFGIPMEEPPNIGVWAGIDRVQQLLAGDVMLIHDNCPGLESDLSTMRRVVKDGVPTDSIEAKETFHLADALRYLVVGLTGESERTETEIIYNPARIG